jgi:hypothetical protein
MRFADRCNSSGRILTIVLALSAALHSQPIHATGKNPTVVAMGTKTRTFVDKDGAYTTANILSGRSLALYDIGGHFDCRRFTKDWFANRSKAEDHITSLVARAREFIWLHWQNKQRGYVRITFNSVDATSTSHIFIEPDGKGHWQLIWRIVRHNNRVNDVPLIRTVEMRSVESKGQLVFKSSDGKVQETL